MATSTVKLYLIPELHDEDNFIIEDAADYITARFSTPLLTLENFQYQRLESNKTIKINSSQALQIVSRPWNYCTIRNSDSPLSAIMLYFVVGYTQRAPQTIELSLKLDVLNMFYGYFKTRFAAGTFIARCHKDRYLVTEVDEQAGTVTLARKFDRISEGDSPRLFGLSQTVETITDRRGSPANFYIIYRNSEGGQPCIDLAASEPLKISESSQGGGAVTISFNDLVDNRYYYLVGDFELTVQYFRDSGTSQEVRYYACNSGFVRFKKVNSQNPNIKGEILFYSNDGAMYNNGAIVTTEYTDYLTGPIVISKGRTVYYSSVETTSSEDVKRFPSFEINAGTYSAEYLGAIAALDRTNSNIVKVIECPYCPIDYTFDSESGLYSFSNFFETKSPEGFFRTFDLTKAFSPRSIRLETYVDKVRAIASISAITSYREPLLDDSKLFTSPYYRPTYFYDSFAWAVKLEEYELTESEDGLSPLGIDINYKQSLSLSSSLLFEFKSMTSQTLPYFEDVISDQNFDKIILANRNNELPLFSSEYLNYLRNGFNYDKKRLSEQAAQGIAGTSIQTLASILSFAFAPATGGLSAAAGIGLAAGAVGSLANLGFSQLQGSEAIEQKIASLKLQSYSVSGVDDLDLFKTYSGNKLKKKIYEISDQEFQRLSKRFAYYGYACGEYATYMPRYLNSRRFYNFLACEPVWLSDMNDIPGEYVEEINEKLRAGVTIWHNEGYHVSNYALNRNVENIENSILEAISNA